MTAGQMNPSHTEAALRMAPAAPPTLLDLLEEGVHLILLLRNGNAPRNSAHFNDQLDSYLQCYVSRARTQGKADEAIEHARYAFCAVLDELILSSNFAIRGEWERMPLQLRLFGEHLAGEGFFERLAHLRLAPSENLEVLELFHMALQLGFRGRYLLEERDKLDYLKRGLRDEIGRLRGEPHQAVAHWRLPDSPAAPSRRGLPLRLYLALLLAATAAFFGTYRWLLGRQVSALFGL